MSGSSRRLLKAACSAISLTLLSSASLAQSVTAPSDPWAQAASDIPADPSVRFGVLPNGMRYALRQNATPPGRAALRLRIDAGSLVESDDQRGLAHFMEHMAFNGTTNLPENELVTTLEGLGLAFGADTNAFTSFDQTAYMLDLPRSDDGTLDTALMVLREQVSRSVMDPAAIDAERGVIAGEKRLRDTPAQRALLARLGLLEPRLTQRLPIGDLEVISTAPRERFAAFYDAYYRPSRSTLIAVGDFDVDAMENKVREAFADWMPKGPEGPDVDRTASAPARSDVSVLVEPGTSARVGLTWTRAPDLSPDTVAKRGTQLIERIGLDVLNQRLEDLSRSDDPPFLRAWVSAENLYDFAEAQTLSAEFNSGGLGRAIAAIEQEHRRILLHGVSERELRRQVVEWRTGLESGVAGSATRDTESLAGAILEAVNDDLVHTSRETDLVLFSETVADLTVEEVNAAVRATFDGAGPFVLVQTPRPVDGGEGAVRAALDASAAMPVSDLTGSEDLAWPYTDFGPPGVIAGRSEISQFETSVIRFANGVTLMVKPTGFADDEVIIAVSAGAGEQAFSPARIEPILSAPGVIVEGGLGRLTNSEIDEVLVGRETYVSFQPRGDHFLWEGYTRPADLDLQMQLMTAYLVDPGLRNAPLDKTKATYAFDLERAMATPAGAWAVQSREPIAGGDKRAASPGLDVVQAWTMADIGPRFTDATAQGPITVIMVGDVTLEDAIAATAPTLGALPERGPLMALPGADQRRFPQGGGPVVQFHHTGDSDQAQAFIGWPTVDAIGDRSNTREVSLLARVLNLRILSDIRERLGIAYSAGAGAGASASFADYGYISAVASVSRDDIEPFYDAIDAIVTDLQASPISQDELNRARAPQLSGIAESESTNAFWLTELQTLARDPRHADEILTGSSDLERLTPMDIQRLARSYLMPQKAWRATVTAGPSTNR